MSTLNQIDLGFTSERFPAGTHMCYIYNNEEERREVISRYLGAGIANGELVGYFADVDELVDGYLEEMGVAVPDEARKNRLLLSRSKDTYCPDGRFVIDRTLEKLKEFHHTCLDRGLPASRVSGEMGWALQPIEGREGLIEYEARVNILLQDHPVTAICQYDTSRFDGATIFDVLSVHPMMVVYGQVVKNPYFIAPEVFLAKFADG